MVKIKVKSSQKCSCVHIWVNCQNRQLSDFDLYSNFPLKRSNSRRIMDELVTTIGWFSFSVCRFYFLGYSRPHFLPLGIISCTNLPGVCGERILQDGLYPFASFFFWQISDVTAGLMHQHDWQTCVTRDSDSSPTRATFLVTRTQTWVTMYNDSDSTLRTWTRTRTRCLWLGLDGKMTNIHYFKTLTK